MQQLNQESLEQFHRAAIQFQNKQHKRHRENLVLSTVVVIGCFIWLCAFVAIATAN